MPFEFKLCRTVEFHETDMAGIMHFSNYFRFMEAAESAFYRSLGYSVVMDKHDPPVSFPRVHAECDYFAPVRFEDTVETHLLVEAKRPRVLTYRFRFHNVRTEGPQLVACGRVVAVCVARQKDGRMEAVPMPTDLYQLLSIAPPELLQSEPKRKP